MVLQWISPYRSWLRCGALFELSLSSRIMNCYRLVAVYKKKFFSFFTLTPSLFAVTDWLTTRKSVRVSVRVNFLPSHLPSVKIMAPQTIPVAIDKCTYRASIRNVIEYCLVNKQEKRYQKSAAPWYQRCSIGVLLVYQCCTTRKAIVTNHDTKRVPLTNKQKNIVNFCSVPRTSREILERVGVVYHTKKYSQIHHLPCCSRVFADD